jgi:hypothetical protein
MHLDFIYKLNIIISLLNALINYNCKMVNDLNFDCNQYIINESKIKFFQKLK